MLLVTVHDIVGGTWSNPVVALNEASAKRDFDTACANDTSLMGLHPEHFQLFAIADWLPSLEDGKLPIFRAYDAPKCIATGVPTDGNR